MTQVHEPIDATDRYIGGRLLGFRRAMGLELSDVAHAGAVRPAELAAIEAGEGKVYMSTLWRLCQVLQADLEDVLPVLNED
jgi:transcriptional regulator with XRE-family HTH domain